MGRRIPDAYAELWYGFRISDDAEWMYTAIGVAGATLGTTIDQAYVDGMLNLPMTHIRSMVSVEYYIKPSHILFGDSLTEPLKWEFSGAETDGTRTGTSLPNNCAWLIRKRTATGGRANRGRMYVPGCVESAVSKAGVVDGVVLLSLQTAATGIRTTLTGHADIDALALFHEPRDPYDPSDPNYDPEHPDRKDPDTADSPTLITELTVQPKIATQRRRMRP